jgi:predicted short-subunit dehydrogenase-like oxidoreductase (DUF2520 family)
MKIVIIGSGNTATILGRLFKTCGHTVIQVVGRNEAEVLKLSKLLGCEPSHSLENLSNQSELYVLAVSDSAIAPLAEQIRLQKGILVHTAGSVSKDVLCNSCRNYGVLYPLQSLRKELTELPDIPFLIDGNHVDEITLLTDFALTLSPKVSLANDEQRKQFHLGAILVNNFPNYLYAKVHDFLTENSLDFSVLHPLIVQTAKRLAEQAPHETQTGPAVRGDQQTIERHLSMLEGYPDLYQIYELFTRNIKSYFGSKL